MSSLTNFADSQAVASPALQSWSRGRRRWDIQKARAVHPHAGETLKPHQGGVDVEPFAWSIACAEGATKTTLPASSSAHAAAYLFLCALGRKIFYPAVSTTIFSCLRQQNALQTGASVACYKTLYPLLLESREPYARYPANLLARTSSCLLAGTTQRPGKAARPINGTPPFVASVGRLSKGKRPSSGANGREISCCVPAI